MHFLSKHLTFGLNGETRTPCETPYEIRMKSAAPSGYNRNWFILGYNFQMPEGATFIARLKKF